jgi:hypothetical protein
MMVHEKTVKGFKVAIEVTDKGDAMVRAWENGIKEPVALMDGHQARILMEHCQQFLPPAKPKNIGGGRHG